MPRPTRSHAAPRRRSGGGFLLGAFIGLILGLAIAVGVAFYLNKTPIPFLGKAKPPAGKDAGADEIHNLIPLLNLLNQTTGTDIQVAEKDSK